MPELSLSYGMDCHTDFARSHMNIICLISSEPDRQIGQSEFSPIWRWNTTPLQGMNPLRSHQPKILITMFVELCIESLANTKVLTQLDIKSKHESPILCPKN